MEAIWYIKENNVWVAQPDPCSLQVDGEDLDLDSYRSVKNGNLIRNILGYKWQKVQFEFALKTEQEAIALLNKVKNTYPLTIKVKSPFGNPYSELVGYVSKCPVEAVAYRNQDTMELAWKCSFNFVEARR